MVRLSVLAFLILVPMTVWGADLGLPYLTDSSPHVYMDNQAGSILGSVYAELRSAASELVDPTKQGNTISKYKNAALYYSQGAPFGQYGTWARFVVKDRETEVYGLQISSNGDPLSFQERLGGLTAFITSQGVDDLTQPGDKIYIRLISPKGYVSFGNIGKPGSIFREGPESLFFVPYDKNPLRVLDGGLHGLSGEALISTIQNSYMGCSDKGSILDYVAYLLMDHQTPVIPLVSPEGSLNSQLPSLLTKLKPSAFNGCPTGGL